MMDFSMKERLDIGTTAENNIDHPNHYLHGGRGIMNLQKLYAMQNNLDKFIIEKSYGYKAIEDHNAKCFLNDRLLALFAEVGEFANATRCFKYWSRKPQESKERLLDEYVDILHFYLSIGNTMKFTSDEVENAYLKKYAENFKRQENGY